MLQRFFLLIGLGSMAVGPALADIVDVTVNGSASGSGGYATYCFPPPGSPEPSGCFQPGGPGSGPYVYLGDYTFSQTNTALGMFSASGSASPAEMYVAPASVSSYADQNTTATADSLNIDLTGGYSTSPIFSFYSNEQDSISVGFDLTEPSVVLFQGGLYPGVGLAPNAGELLDSNNNVILTIPFAQFGVSQTLQPGLYYLDSSVSGSDRGSFVSSASGGEDFNLSLSATFTPVVTPEPRGSLVGALIVAMLGGFVISRRRKFGSISTGHTLRAQNLNR